MADFEPTWRRISALVGQRFSTTTGKPFTYTVDGNHVTTDRTDYPLHRSQFEKAWELMPLAGPGQISKLVRGPSYVYAILTDSRVRE